MVMTDNGGGAWWKKGKEEEHHRRDRIYRRLRQKGRVSSSGCMMMLLLLLVLWVCCNSNNGIYCLAVDRSKFRTCAQTSFCRRHRHAASDAGAAPNRAFFQYQLIADSIQFHPSTTVPHDDGDESHPGGGTTNEEGDPGAAGGGGMWKSIQRRLLGGSKQDSDGNGKDNHPALLDPYVRGPSPTVTGLLQNVAPHSQAQSLSSSGEYLQWSLTALENGIVRMRVTEVYGTAQAPFQKARVTYDELVLHHPAAWHTASHLQWLAPPSDNNNNKDTNAEADFAREVKDAINILRQLIPAGDDIHNYRALMYSDDKDTAEQQQIVLIRLEPFTVSLYRRTGGNSPHNAVIHGPSVVLGAEEMMYFEVRRVHPGEEQPQPQRQEQEQQQQLDEDGTIRDDGDKTAKKEKEIVGYWEDGLAIYADGTREERAAEPDQDAAAVAAARRLAESNQPAELDSEGLWEEVFSSHTDSKPYGPMSVGMDISFPDSTHLFGIPEHASSTVLKTTIGPGAHYRDPYRLYNLDVFEYELDETMALYGSVPLVVSQSVAHGTVGVFWFNPTETFIDVEMKQPQQDQDDVAPSSLTHWMSESGVMDIFLLPGPDPTSMYAQYAKLTGTSPLPPMFSLGYHQCRWNYKDEKDVYYVHGKFEELDYPYDVLWLDIEHTDDKRYFTWDSNNFPHPAEMQHALAAQGRHMVTIIDPHIKRDMKYYIHKEATAKGLYVKDKDGQKDYDGWCWPGSSSYLDFTAEHVRSWWADQFHYSKYHGSTPTLFTWNDMNEPSVFNGPEVSMQKDLRNLNGEEHREWHNLYGMLFHRSTSEGQIRRNAPDEDVRPFVLSRSFFAGSQRYGAIWTGDNAAQWSHLEVAVPMLLSLNVAALSFVGADVGGFFGNPDAELFTRWMQAGAYQPFFRGHAHHDSKRREPWMFDDETLNRLRRAAMTRYALLPYWYTVFQHTEITGMPLMRTMWMQYPNTEALFALDDQFLIGSDLLVKPVTKAGMTETQVLFPTDHIWYDAESLALVSSSVQEAGVTTITIPSDIETIPAFQRGGSILFRKLRLRRSTMTMKTDPYTMYVALDDKKQATGGLYMDDEESFGYLKRFEYSNATVTADLAGSSSSIQNTVTVGSGWLDLVLTLAPARMVERIIVMGLSRSPKAVVIASMKSQSEEVKLSFSYDAATELLVIRQPEVSALEEWIIQLTF